MKFFLNEVKFSLAETKLKKLVYAKYVLISTS